MFKQVLNNPVTAEIFEFLKEQYGDKKSSVDSLITQLKEVGKIIGCDDWGFNIRGMIKKIDNLNTCQNIGLLDSIKFIINNSNYIEQKNL